MAENKVQGNEVIAEGFLDPAIKNTRELVTELKKVEDAIIAVKGATDQSLKQKRDPQTSAELKKVNDLLEKSTKLRKLHNAQQKESAKLKKQLIAAQDKEAKGRIRLRTVTQQQTKALKEEVKAELGLIDATARLEKQVNAAQRELKNLAVTEGLTSKATLDAQKKFEGLDKKLRDVNRLAKDGRRDVGRYNTAFDGLGFSITQVSRELPAFAFGINTGIAALSNNLPILFDELSKARKEIEALQAAGKEAPTLFQRISKAIFNWQTVLVLAVTALTIFGREIQEFVKNLSNADDAVELSAETQSASMGRIISKIHELIDARIDLAVAEGKISNEEGERRKIREQQRRSELELEAELSKNALEIAKKLDVEKSRIFDNETRRLVFQETDRAKVIDNVREEINKRRAKSGVGAVGTRELRQAAKNRLKENEEINKALVNVEKLFQKELDAIRRKAEIDKLLVEAKGRASTTTDNKEAEEKRIEELKILRDLEVENIEGSYEKQRALLITKFNDDFELYKDNAAIILELQRKLNRDLEELDREREKQESDAAERIRKEILANDKWVADQKKKAADRERKERIAELRDRINTARQITRALSDELDKRNDLRQQARDEELDKTSDAIRRQEELAQRGADNQLAFEKAKNERLLLENREALEKEARQQELIKLGEAYLNAYNLRLSRQGQNPETAPFEALKDVLIAKGVAKGLVQFFAEGTDYVQGAGTGTSDSIPAMLSKGEGVVKEVANRENSGVVKSLNDGSFSNKFIPVYESNNEAATQVVGDFGYSSNQEVVKLLRDIKDKPVQHVDVNKLNQIVETVYANGTKKTTTHLNRVRL
jgi:hypothetical protein